MKRVREEFGAGADFEQRVGGLGRIVELGRILDKGEGAREDFGVGEEFGQWLNELGRILELGMSLNNG